MNVYSSAIHKANRRKQLKCPPADEWKNKLWFIHTMGYFSATQRNDVLIHATAWINLENSLSEQNQTQKAMCARFHLYKMSRIGKPIDHWLPVWGKGMGSNCLMGTGLPFRAMNIF